MLQILRTLRKLKQNQALRCQSALQISGARILQVKLKVWRQAGPNQPGKLVDYTADNVHPDMSFLEMLDVVN